METNFNFKSQPATSREQSERLLALGLKKETADCRHWAYTKDSKGNPIPKRNQRWFTRIGTDESAQVCGFMDTTFIPAWSFDRLWEILPKDVEIDDDHNVTCHLEGENAIIYHDYGCEYYNFDKRNNRYDNIIDCIKWLIKEGYFNKEYLGE